MTHGSLFSGIGGFDEGFRRAGFEAIWQVEKEPFCRAVLATRFTEAFRFNDVKECGKHNLGAVDVLTAGFPCQDLSVAGKRAGLEGSRSGLFWEVVRILGELKPTWFVLENVPGLFSSCEGRDFAVVLNALDELGYGLAWRVLNSQFFGVAQRRRRVFIVGCFGKPCPAEVLFEPESSGGNFETCGETRKELASEIAASLRGVGGSPRGFTLDAEQGLAVAISASAGHHGHSSPRGDGSDNIIVQQAISSKWAKGSSGPAGDEHHNLVCGTLGDRRGPGAEEAGSNRLVRAPADSHGVRTFAGLPKGLDSARYRALGNAVTVSVSEWIGRRILAIDAHEQSPCVGQGPR